MWFWFIVLRSFYWESVRLLLATFPSIIMYVGSMLMFLTTNANYLLLYCSVGLVSQNTLKWNSTHVLLKTRLPYVLMST